LKKKNVTNQFPEIDANIDYMYEFSHVG